MESTTQTTGPNEIAGMLSPVVRQLVELWNGPENDDYGRLRPTRDAFDATIQLLTDTARKGISMDGRFRTVARCPTPRGACGSSG